MSIYTYQQQNVHRINKNLLSKVQYIFRLHNVPIPTIFTLKTSLTYYQHVMHFSRWNSFIKTRIRITSTNLLTSMFVRIDRTSWKKLSSNKVSASSNTKCCNWECLILPETIQDYQSIYSNLSWLPTGI